MDRAILEGLAESVRERFHRPWLIDLKTRWVEIDRSLDCDCRLDAPFDVYKRSDGLEFPLATVQYVFMVLDGTIQVWSGCTLEDEPLLTEQDVSGKYRDLFAEVELTDPNPVGKILDHVLEHLDSCHKLNIAR